MTFPQPLIALIEAVRVRVDGLRRATDLLREDAENLSGCRKEFIADAECTQARIGEISAADDVLRLQLTADSRAAISGAEEHAMLLLEAHRGFRDSLAAHSSSVRAISGLRTSSVTCVRAEAIRLASLRMQDGPAASLFRPRRS